MMKRFRTKLFFCIFQFLFFYFAFSQEPNPCKKTPTFLNNLKLSYTKPAFSSTEKNVIGIVYTDVGESSSTQKPRFYQDSSWKKFGYISTITQDNYGNVFAIPTPFISMLYSNKWKMNRILKINTLTGKMDIWHSFNENTDSMLNNPFGMMGLTFDCRDTSLWVSSIYGSTRKEEKGKIYHIQTKTKKIIDSIVNTDAMGLALNFEENGMHKLYLGSLRNGNIYSYIIDPKGKLIKESKKLEITLQNLGARGDDKPRKIVITKTMMVVRGISFNYNLQAVNEKPESIYRFQKNRVTDNWALVSID